MSPAHSRREDGRRRWQRLVLTPPGPPTPRQRSGPADRVDSPAGEQGLEPSRIASWSSTRTTSTPVGYHTGPERRAISRLRYAPPPARADGLYMLRNAHTRGVPPRTGAKVALSALVIGALGSFAALGVYGLFTATTQNSGNEITSGTVELADNDSGSALYNTTGVRPGDTTSRCIETTYTGSFLPQSASTRRAAPGRSPRTSTSRSPRAPRRTRPSLTAPASRPTRWAHLHRHPAELRADPQLLRGGGRHCAGRQNRLERRQLGRLPLPGHPRQAAAARFSHGWSSTSIPL